MTDRVAMLIAGWFGCGYAPSARGTWGSLAAVAVACALVGNARAAPWHLGVLALLVTPCAIWAASRAEKLLGKEDPPFVVVDEVVGQWAALAAAAVWNWKSVLAGFVLFRLFDIWKPAPVRQLERLHGGLGIVADDLMAGVYAALVLRAMGWFNLY